MKYSVIEFMAELAKYNRHAKVYLVVEGIGYEDVTFAYGKTEGCTRANCEEVAIYIEDLPG